MNGGNPTAAEIVVQIVHMEGPFKGQIYETEKPVIVIGRDPGPPGEELDIRYPRDLKTVSRKHAEIKRQGNAYLFVNLGQNRSSVNGQVADNVYLKSGDVITFASDAPNGPKVSFLWAAKSGQRRRAPEPEVGAHQPAPQPPPPLRAGPPSTSPGIQPSEAAPVTVQYGISIRSFKKASVRLGKDGSNDFVLDHPRVFGAHAEIFFHKGQYYVRDLTESRACLLNGNAVTSPTPLQDNDVLTLGEGGPKLRYLGTGRFSELLE